MLQQPENVSVEKIKKTRVNFHLSESHVYSLFSNDILSILIQFTFLQ